VVLRLPELFPPQSGFFEKNVRGGKRVKVVKVVKVVRVKVVKVIVVKVVPINKVLRKRVRPLSLSLEFEEKKRSKKIRHLLFRVLILCRV